MPTQTVRALCTRSLRDLGVVAGGETPSGDDITDVAFLLNDLIDGLGTEKLLLGYRQRTTWAIVSGTATYTLGLTGTVNIARPAYVDRIKFLDTAPSPDVEYDLVQLTDAAYECLAQPDLQMPQPWAVYYNPTFPLGTITFVGVPTSTTLRGVIWFPVGQSELATLDTSIVMPFGWSSFLRNALNVAAGPSFGKTPTDLAVFAATADAMKANIKRSNMRRQDLMLPGGGGIYDITADVNV